MEFLDYVNSCTTATTSESTLTKEKMMDVLNSIPVKTSLILPSKMREPRMSSWIKKHIKDKGLLGKIFYKSVPCAYVMERPEIFMHPKNFLSL
jgi:hypothetical protein